MSIENKFEQATRAKLRITTVQGPIGVEDLWTLPLTTTNPGKYTSLDDIARALHKKLGTAETVSFVEDVVASDAVSQLSFDLVLHVISVIKAENTARRDAHAKAEKKQKLLALLDKRQSEADNALTEEQIREQLAAL